MLSHTRCIESKRYRRRWYNRSDGQYSERFLRVAGPCCEPLGEAGAQKSLSPRDVGMSVGERYYYGDKIFDVRFDTQSRENVSPAMVALMA